MIVLDASLAVKLVVRETDSDKAVRWYMSTDRDIGAPSLIAVEVAQAIVRRVNLRLLPAAKGRATFQTWRAFLDDAITLSDTSLVQLDAAVELAMFLGHPVKDCIYLALAIEHDCDLATCDAKFAVKARTVHSAVKLLSDYLPF